MPPKSKILLQGHILSIKFYKLDYYVKNQKSKFKVKVSIMVGDYNLIIITSRTQNKSIRQVESVATLFS